MRSCIVDADDQPLRFRCVEYQASTDLIGGCVRLADIRQTCPLGTFGYSPPAIKPIAAIWVIPLRSFNGRPIDDVHQSNYTMCAKCEQSYFLCGEAEGTWCVTKALAFAIGEV